MKAYVLTNGYDDEGEDVRSVHLTLAGAQAEIAGAVWQHTEPWGGTRWDTWYTPASGSPDYHLIHEMEVQP